MENKSWAGTCCLVVLISLFTGCTKTPEKRYLEHEKKELAKGIRHDSLFMGVYLKMPQNKFRDYCFNMNLEGKFKQGGMKSSSWVEAKIKGTKYPMTINFYPVFLKDSISEMNATIYYENAIFYDGAFERDSLMYDVLQLMDIWYGGPIFKIKSPAFYKEDLHVKINGNRRITIYPDASGQMINLWYVDLTQSKGELHGRKD